MKRIKDKYDVIIVGGGPAGSVCAAEIAKSGHSVCLFEKDRDIGYPVRCGEAIGFSGLNNHFKPKDTWIASEIVGAHLIAPNKKCIDVDFANEVGFILNRRIFDYDISRNAVLHGAEVYTKSYVEGLIIEDDFVKGVKVNYLGNTISVKSHLVIGADGVESRVGRWAGIRTNVRMKDMESALQYSVADINLKQNDKMIMYVGKKYAPGGYLWIFPKGEGFANIGIGISGDNCKETSAKECLDRFIDEEYPNVSILSTVCGGVPCPKPMKEPIFNGLMLTGDAAHHINPMTGGGIASGMTGGKIAGKVAIDALSASNYSKEFLQSYVKILFKDFCKTHNRFYRIKEALHDLTDDDLNYIADKACAIPKEKRTLGSVFKYAVFKKPSLLIDVLKVFTGY